MDGSSDMAAEAITRVTTRTTARRTSTVEDGGWEAQIRKTCSSVSRNSGSLEAHADEGRAPSARTDPRLDAGPKINEYHSKLKINTDARA